MHKHCTKSGGISRCIVEGTVPGHDCLPVWTDVKEDLADLWLKPHVQHPVSLVQDLASQHSGQWQKHHTQAQNVWAYLDLHRLRAFTHL